MTNRQTARPLWLITLADLALLLVGFFVFVQATQRQDARTRAALAAGIRDAFGGIGTIAAPPRMAVDANVVSGFAPGSAAPPALGAVLAWTGDAARDPRTILTVTGSADGSAADRRDGSALALAAERAATVAAAIEAQLPARRIRIGAAIAPPALAGRPAGRRVTVTIAFAP